MGERPGMEAGAGHSRETEDRPVKRRTLKKQMRRWMRGEIARVSQYQGFYLRKLKGQGIVFGYGGATDEGWSSRGYHVRPNDLTVSEHDDGADCDGRLSSGGERRFVGIDKEHTARFRVWYPEERFYVAGKWAEVDAYRRDYQAEDAGY